MGKASQRRRIRRTEFLSKLASCDPTQFSIEWTKRLESWSHELKRNTARLVDPMGRRTPLGSDLLHYADKQLAACGLSAVQAEGDATRAILNHHLAAALASAVDKRSYRLTNTDRASRRSDLYVVARKKTERRHTS
jgi:hypothetical protein